MCLYNGWGDGEPMVSKTGKAFAHWTHSWVMKTKSSCYKATSRSSSSSNQHLSRDSGQNSQVQSTLGKTIALWGLVGSPGLSQSETSWALNQKLKVKSQVTGKPFICPWFWFCHPLVSGIGLPWMQILDLPLIRPFDLAKVNFSEPQFPYLYNGDKIGKLWELNGGWFK